MQESPWKVEAFSFLKAVVQHHFSNVFQIRAFVILSSVIFELKFLLSASDKRREQSRVSNPSPASFTITVFFPRFPNSSRPHKILLFVVKFTQSFAKGRGRDKTATDKHSLLCCLHKIKTYFYVTR